MSHTPAHKYVPVNQRPATMSCADRARLADLEERDARGALSTEEYAELRDLLIRENADFVARNV